MRVSSSAATAGTVTLNTNTYTKIGTLTGAITLETGSQYTNGLANEFSGEFTVGTSVYSVTWGGVTETVVGSPTIRVSHKYVFSIMEGVLILCEAE